MGRIDGHQREEKVLENGPREGTLRENAARNSKRATDAAAVVLTAATGTPAARDQQ